MILACSNIRKSFGIDTILDNITFHIEEKEKVGIVGVNGAGKSTLFKILTGDLAHDEGEIFRAKDTSLGYLSQDMGIDEKNTIITEMFTVFSHLIDMEEKLRQLESSMGKTDKKLLESLMEDYARLQHTFEEQNGYGYKSQIRGVLKGLGFSEEEFEQPIQQLSGGQKTRVALGKLLLQQPSILLLDEPTNHLDIGAIQWLEDFLKAYSGAVLIISHDRYFLDRIVTKIVEIENKKSFVYEGDYSFYARHKELNRAVLVKQYLDQQKEIKRQEQVIMKLRSFNREKSIKRAESREKLLDKVDRLEKPENLPEKMRFSLEPKIMSGYDVLHVENLSKSFDLTTLFQNLTFDIKREEKVALLGPNGIGKTTIFRIFVGQLPPSNGLIRFGTNVKIGYYDQEQQNLTESKTIMEEISDTYPTLTQTEIRNMLAAFLFTGDDVFKPISALSGGERGRVSLAKLMLSGANFLLLDEPTNHLDMFSKEILEDALNNFTGTVLYISHDRYFINKTAHRILDLSPVGVTQYQGNYSYYLEKKAQCKAKETVLEATITDSKASSIKDDWLRKKEEQAKEKRRQTQIAQIEEKIASTEERIKLLDEQLCVEEVYSNPQKAKEIYDEKTALEDQLLDLYAQWELLQE